MSFDEIFDLTAGVYFNFYNIVQTHVRQLIIQFNKQRLKNNPMRLLFPFVAEFSFK